LRREVKPVEEKAALMLGRRVKTVGSAARKSHAAICGLIMGVVRNYASLKRRERAED
jgi:hypothetical protein